MSKQLINQYYSKLDRIIQYGGSENESAIKNAFYSLLNNYANKRQLELVTEIPCKGTKGVNVIPDGIVKNALRLDCGYWESKDKLDDLDEEINKKIKKGYPTSNILFEDCSTAVLIQQNNEIVRVDMKDVTALDDILTKFITYEHPEVKSFNEAIEQFKQDIPTIIETLHKTIKTQIKQNKKLQSSLNNLYELCKEVINPDITLSAIQEMLIQHILTEEIFISIFGDAQFHLENNVAKELNKVEQTFFVGKTKRQTLDIIKNYYEMIKARATMIVSHHEKQKFLKVIYENFYKAYNPKGADILGIVYTPNEIVNFIIEGTEHLLLKHFNKTLADKNVEILDPATGTGTFICDLIEYLPNQHLTYKYKNEIHANEVAILPYYIANLNIEYTFKQKMGYYEEFKNICFVDTLDNVSAFDYSGRQPTMFGFSGENTERIKNQNQRKISVIIGNPPYNANQQNENDKNKNRKYKEVDKRIKETYILYSSAQKTKVYDMYARFYRWATDRIDKNGIIAFITNRSFIDSRTFDGFRKCVEDEFNLCYIIDTKSDVRANPKIAGTTHNVFGIQTGVAVIFLVKKEIKENGCNISYFSLQDEQRKEEKLNWFHTNKLRNIPFIHIQSDKNHNWINITDNDFEELIPLVDKNVKIGESENAVFKLFSNGIVTSRDEWTYDFSIKELKSKVKFFCNFYESERVRWIKSDEKTSINDFVDRKIKWTSELEEYLKKGTKLKFNEKNIIWSLYRPFIKQNVYFDKIITHRIYQNANIFGFKNEYRNVVIAFSGKASSKHFQTLATNHLFSFDLLEKTQCLPLYRYDKYGSNVDNITDWGLKQFITHYKSKKITKEDIFYYTYAVLHNPQYCKKYELNLKREFPRLPFYNDFFKWRDWGKALMDLHINYETIKPYKLKQSDLDLNPKSKQKSMFRQAKVLDKNLFGIKPKLKIKLKANKETGAIEIDEQTTLSDIPKKAWEYKLGNRSAFGMDT